VRDNIDTDQIISAQFLNLVPTIPEEYEKLGSYALDGLPKSLYPTASSRKASSTANIPSSSAGKISAAAARANTRPSRSARPDAKLSSPKVSRAFSSATPSPPASCIPAKSPNASATCLKTGDIVTVDLDAATVTVKATGKVIKFKPLGDVRPVVDAGGLFNYARKSGMIAK
jgi:3-isopropylmalate/(R)-2-methylmalate dehydratase small subunit